MNGTMAIREATVGAADVLELPYGEGEFALVIAMPARAEQALDTLEQDVTGADLIGWLPLLKPVTVTLQLPKFRVRPNAMPLKEPLMAAGMTAPFSAGADFEPMVDKANLVLDNVIHAAGVVVDEEGSVATAATAAVVRSKSIAAGPPVRKIDRPFLFAIVHKPSATPLFVGRLSNPARD